MSDDSTTQGVTGLLKLPATTRSPWWELMRRVLMAVGILVFTVLLVWFDRDGYTDANDPTEKVDLVRRDLLHDRHAEHDRVRRHRPCRASTLA